VKKAKKVKKKKGKGKAGKDYILPPPTLPKKKPREYSL